MLAITQHRLVVIQMVLLQDPDFSSVFSSLLQAGNNIYFAILTMHFSILEFAFGIDFPAFPEEQICYPTWKHIPGITKWTRELDIIALLGDGGIK